MIYVGITGTTKYSYALPNVGRRLASALALEKKGGKVVYIADKNPSLHQLIKKYIGERLPATWELQIVSLDVSDDNVNYGTKAQLLIAQLQGEALSVARKEGASLFWSIESDVLVPHNSLRVLKDCLRFDNGYYDVAMATYPSQGGGSYLGGHGDYRHYIAEDFTLEERDVPKKLLQAKERLESQKKKDDKWHEKYKDVMDQIRQHPPKENIYALNGKKWKRRGWMDYAYPAIGKGAIVPTDWIGMGCTLLSKEALAMAHFDGYEGKGTQDLYLGWNRWKPAGMNMCVTTHAICDHVIRERAGDKEQDYKKIKLVNARHEPDGEFAGHLRQEFTEHYQFTEEELKDSPTIVGEE